MGITTGIVSAKVLNVRPEASTEKSPIGQLQRGSTVQILEKLNEWYRIRAGQLTGYVASDYLTIVDPSPVADYLWEMADLQTAALEPPSGKMIPLLSRHTAAQRTAAMTWNSQGGLLQVLSDIIAIKPSCAVAVLCVESGDSGFGTDGRMIIRFENHIFWNQWGKLHPDSFNAHFRFNPQKNWLGHQFRENAADPWIAFHGTQAQEWKVLSYARNFEENAALNATSMGAAQIMGFNSARLGYDTVKDMYDHFSTDIRYQVLGLFDFLRGPGTTSPMIEALQRQDYTQFASYYNGPAQAPIYGARIENHVKAFESL